MALAPFDPTGVAVSSSSVSVGPGTPVFDLDTTTITIPDGCLAQAVAGDNAEEWVLGKVIVVSPTQIKLIVGDVSGVNYSGSETHENWRIKVVALPAEPVPLFGITGLRVTCATGSDEVKITSGSVRDSTDRVNLVLVSPLTKYLHQLWAAGGPTGGIQQSADLPGTITSVGTAVTGTETSFTFDFDGRSAIADREGGYLSDYSTQLFSIAPFIGTGFDTPSIIESGGVATTTPTVSSATALTTTAPLGVTGATYRRGGICDATYGVCLIRKDSDGSTDVCLTAFTGRGSPDLPPGYSQYRVIALLTKSGTSRTIVQLLRALSSSPAAEISYDNVASGLGATNTQAAIDELKALVPADVAKLTSGTVSAAATLDIVLTAYTGYRELVFFLTNLVPASDVVDLLCRVSTSAGVSYDGGSSNYIWTCTAAGNRDSGVETSHSSNTSIRIAGDVGFVTGSSRIGNGGSEGISCIVRLPGQANGAIKPTVHAYGSYYTSGDDFVTFFSGGVRNAAQDTDAIRFLFSSGDIASGSYAVYGYK